jgi:hypothetical protein
MRVIGLHHLPHGPRVCPNDAPGVRAGAPPWVLLSGWLPRSAAEAPPSSCGWYKRIKFWYRSSSITRKVHEYDKYASTGPAAGADRRCDAVTRPCEPWSSASGHGDVVHRPSQGSSAPSSGPLRGESAEWPTCRPGLPGAGHSRWGAADYSRESSAATRRSRAPAGHGCGPSRSATAPHQNGCPA